MSLVMHIQSMSQAHCIASGLVFRQYHFLYQQIHPINAGSKIKMHLAVVVFQRWSSGLSCKSIFIWYWGSDTAGCCMWSIASAVRYLFPPGVARRPQHGHGRLCGASLHSWLKRLCCCHCLMPSVHSGTETERQMNERERKGSNCGTEKEKVQ